MKKHKKKIYIVLICCILVCTAAAGWIYKSKNSTKNILIGSLYNKVEKGEVLDEELLKSYNAKNLEKLNRGKDLSAEDYFLIAYEYCAVKKEREEGVKYAEIAKSKKNSFTNRYIQIYSYYLINYYDTYIKKDDSVLERIDEEFKDIELTEWNKYYNLLYAKLQLYYNYDIGVDYIINKFESLLEHEEKLDADRVAFIKDTLIALYSQKGHYAKALETCLEMESMLQKYDVNRKDYFESRVFVNMGIIYQMLGDYDAAIELYKKTLNTDVSDKAQEGQVKMLALTNLISINLDNNNIDEVPELLDYYKRFVDEDSVRGQDLLYYFSLAEYYIEKSYGNQEISYENDFIQIMHQIQLIKEQGLDGGGIVIGFNERSKIYSYYLEYLQGNVDQALGNYKELLESSTDNMIKRFIIEKVIRIYRNEGDYEQAYEYSLKLMDIQNDESLLINQDYSAYSIEKYENELEIRKLNEQKLNNYIRRFVFILVSSICVIILFMRNRTLREKNITDGLTQIYNRTYFNEVFNKKLQDNKGFYLFIFDIDNFKKVNDTYGHLIGDEVLKKVAKTAKDAIGNNGSIFRYGGEEFVVLADPKDEVTIRNMAEKIRREVERLIWDNGMEITISLGIADSRVEKENVLEVADKHLYLSKTTGKNKVTLAS